MIKTKTSALKLKAEEYDSFLAWLFPQFKLLSFIQSYWLHGSRAAETYDKYSDLDIGIIVKKETDKKKIFSMLDAKLSHREFHDYFNDSIFNYWTFNGKEVGVHLYTREEFTARVSSFTTNFEGYNSGQDFVQHVVLNSHIFLDYEDFFLLLKKKCRIFIDENKNDFIGKYLKRLRQEAEWWAIRGRWRSVFEEMTQINQFIIESAKCHHLLNGQVYLRSLKHYDIDLDKFLPDIKNEIMDIASINPYDLDCTHKIKLMNQIYEKLLIYSKLK